MSGHENLQRVLDSGIVAILRAPSSEQLTSVARALFEGGIDVIEVTFTCPDTLQILAAVKKELGSRVLLVRHRARSRNGPSCSAGRS